MWRFCGPLQFCLISLTCSKYSFRSCRNSPHISFFNENTLPAAFKKAKEFIFKIEEGSGGFLCRNETLSMHTAIKVPKYRVFSGPYLLAFRPNTGKYKPEKKSVIRHFSRSGIYLYMIPWRWNFHRTGAEPMPEKWQNLRNVVILCYLESLKKLSLHEKCPHLELFWSAFSHICTEYGEIRSISPYLVWMRENMDQNNSEYGHFSSSVEEELGTRLGIYLIAGFSPVQQWRCLRCLDRGVFRTWTLLAESFFANFIKELLNHMNFLRTFPNFS